MFFSFFIKRILQWRFQWWGSPLDIRLLHRLNLDAVWHGLSREVKLQNHPKYATNASWESSAFYLSMYHLYTPRNRKTFPSLPFVVVDVRNNMEFFLGKITLHALNLKFNSAEKERDAGENFSNVFRYYFVGRIIQFSR